MRTSNIVSISSLIISLIILSLYIIDKQPEPNRIESKGNVLEVYIGNKLSHTLAPEGIRGGSAFINMERITTDINLATLFPNVSSGGSGISGNYEGDVGLTTKNTIELIAKEEGGVVITNSLELPFSKDSKAPLNSIYYSSDQSKLVYKDGAGVVNNLY
jgi:hypothetical protein